MMVRCKPNIVVLLFCWTLLLSTAAAFSEQEGIVIIANKDVSAEKLTEDAIRKIFLGDILNWDNNEVIMVVLSGDDTIHNQFIAKYIKRTPVQFQNVWRRNLFTGKGALPPKFNNIDDLIKHVATTKGAIGYAPADAKLTSDVKIIGKE